MVKKLNPWKIPTLTSEHYKFLKKTYGLKDLDFLLKSKPNFIKRNLLIGHDNFDEWVNKAKEKKKIALVSGFMTSGFLHLGSLTILKQIAYYQKKYNVDVIIPIADLEAMCVRKTKYSEVKNTIIKFLAHFFAAGLDPKKTKLYLQTKNIKVLREASLFTSKIDMPELEKIYGRKLTLAEAFSSLVMTSDILVPQMDGYEATLIILGIDEISHFILTKEVISLLGDEFYLPSITYNKILTGLNGSKMGKSIPENSILLTDTPKIAKKKLLQLKNKRLDLFQNTAFNILEWYSKEDSILNKIFEMEKDDKDKANNLAIDEAIKVTNNLLREHRKKCQKYLKKAKEITKILIEE
ncbi:hypothetical protein KAJ87_03805 [Candidatus Pacearchaeota archaeon]|nr:hypothetical protein [Candidatus Pacearchaeota archaeon]